jgi:hypothetical protein
MKYISTIAFGSGERKMNRSPLLQFYEPKKVVEDSYAHPVNGQNTGITTINRAKINRVNGTPALT